MAMWSQIVLKFSFMIMKKMVQNMMFVSHSPLKKGIVSVLDKIRHSRHVRITEPSTNSTTDESSSTAAAAAAQQQQQQHSSSSAAAAAPIAVVLL